MIQLKSGRIIDPAEHYEIWKDQHRPKLSTMDIIREIAADSRNSPEFQAEIDTAIADMDREIAEFNVWQADMERRLKEW